MCGPRKEDGGKLHVGHCQMKQAAIKAKNGREISIYACEGCGKMESGESLKDHLHKLEKSGWTIYANPHFDQTFFTEDQLQNMRQRLREKEEARKAAASRGESGNGHLGLVPNPS